MSEDQRGKPQRPVTQDELQQILEAYCERNGIAADLTEHCSCGCGPRCTMEPGIRATGAGSGPGGWRGTTDDPDGRHASEPVNLTDEPPAEAADAPPVGLRSCW